MSVFLTVCLLGWFKTRMTSLPSMQNFLNFRIPFFSIFVFVLIPIHSLLMCTCRTSTWPVSRILTCSTKKSKNFFGSYCVKYCVGSKVQVATDKYSHNLQFNYSIIDAVSPEISTPRPF